MITRIGEVERKREAYLRAVQQKLSNRHTIPLTIKAL